MSLLSKVFDVIDANTVNTEDIDIGNVGGELYLSTTQTISNDTVTKLNLDTVAENDGNVIADTTNNQITIDTAGKYAISGSVQWEPSSGWGTGDRMQVQVSVNGSIVSPGYQRKVGTGRQTKYPPVIYESFAAGDDIDMRVLQDSGVGKVVGDGESQTYLTVVRLG